MQEIYWVSENLLAEIAKYLNAIIRRVRRITKSDFWLRHIRLLSVCPSVRLEQVGLHWADFHEVRHLSFFFENLSIKFEFH
jgi:hypothetical protein